MITSIKNFIKNNSIFLFILSVGAILRLYQINWGLPDLYEEATPLRIAWQFWNWGKAGLDFNPKFFNYPALTFYIQFIAQVVNYWLGHLFGAYPNIDAFGLTLTPLAVTARIINVLFDCGTIVVIYFAVKEIADKRIAIFASIIAAINPSLILHAHMIEVDPTLTFFSMLSLLFIFRIYHQPKLKWYLLAGLFIGLAASAKYTGAFLVFVLFGAHLLRSETLQQAWQSFKDRYLFFAIGLSAVVFFALNPYIILTPDKFQQDFSFEQYHVSYGHLGVVSSKSTIGYYLGDVLPWSFGWIFSLVIMATIIYFFIRREKKDLLLLIYPFIYLLIVSTWAMRAERYILPIFPVLILIGAIGIGRFAEWFIKYIQRQKESDRMHSLPIIIFAAIGLVSITQPGINDYQYLRSIGLPDTRAITNRWIQNNVKPGSAIATGPYGIELPKSTYTVLSIPFLAVESERVAPFYDVRWYEDFDILVTSSFDRDRYLQEPKRYGDFLPYYDSLRNRWKLAFKIEPTDFQNGPSFWLYTCPDSVKHAILDTSIFNKLYANPESARISIFLNGLDAILYAKGKYAKSEMISREILSVEVNNLPVRNQLAGALINQGKYESALKHLELSLRANPNQPDVYYLAGISLFKINQAQAGEGVLLKAISVASNYEPPYVELINYYTASKQKLKLLEILRRYYSILPESSARAKSVQAEIERLEKQK